MGGIGPVLHCAGGLVGVMPDLLLACIAVV